MAISWNRQSAAHLLRRAGFGATPQQLDLAIERGLERTVDDLLDVSAPDPNLDARLSQAPFDLERGPETKTGHNQNRNDQKAG